MYYLQIVHIFFVKNQVLFRLKFYFASKKTRFESLQIIKYSILIETFEVFVR